VLAGRLGLRLADGRVAVVDDARRLVPRTDAVIADPRLVSAEHRLGRALVRDAVRRAQQQCRDGLIEPEAVPDAAVAGLPARASSLLPVLNATGVLVHTNLGRAPLSAAAKAAVQAAAGTNDIEFDLVTGARGKRAAGLLAALAAAVPDAQAVHVVNNNAAALVLAATALAAGREIVVSRGELIEIGDRFRLPDLLTSTGASITEVGMTNRTTVADYAAVVSERTGFVLKVHPSNYRIEGFTSSASVAELAGLGVPVVGDIGSGLLAPHPKLPEEPDAATWLRAGAALVTASGDKLLGGPQAGLLLGRADLVTRLARHPLARAVRIDKLTVAALEATLTGPTAPVLQALSVDHRVLSDRAKRIAEVLATAGIEARAVDSQAAVGGGGAPGVPLASAAVSVPASLAEPLRNSESVRGGEHPAVVGRVFEGRLLLDLYAIDAADDAALTAAVLTVLGPGGHSARRGTPPNPRWPGTPRGPSRLTGPCKLSRRPGTSITGSRRCSGR